MLVLALDTTTRAGSVALTRDGEVLDVFVGDADRTHAARLPGDLLDCLARHRLRPRDVDVFAVAAGPGSFTGLRIGIATMQGLAFANGKRMVGVSALDALARAALASEESEEGEAERQDVAVAAWMDAQRGEVYAELYRPSAGGVELDVWRPGSVASPAEILEAWREPLSAKPPSALCFVGDGALNYRAVLEAAHLPGFRLVGVVPPLAPVIARAAQRVAKAGGAVAPHAIRPLYIRRPDAELARERARRAAEKADEVASHPSHPETRR